ncbi:hypothetical protein D1610_12845 [Sphingomonas gilva]|uniref:Uncharacterized protein n=1 Tax=Sphingomonas gilva TaxID=2305907 RepID=A0A396RLG2_9SPHN|nr:hypothetical protein [Sphingomonas gilva]RHW17009.1 hypothetical protein D1610_12845 [Sphingomonas gilva]
MTEWMLCKFTEARQVVQLMRVEEAELPEPAVTPVTHFASIRGAEQRAEAVKFLALALPRFESIAWAGHVLEREALDRRLPARDRQALDFALRWLGDPDDARRRAAFEAAEAAGDRAPERLLALAVFFSGGSISMPDLPPVLPPPESSGTFAGAAVLAAAFRSDNPDEVLDRALDLGEAVASNGMDALTAR